MFIQTQTNRQNVNSFYVRGKKSRIKIGEQERWSEGQEIQQAATGLESKVFENTKRELNVILYTKVGDTGLLKTRTEALKLLK